MKVLSTEIRPLDSSPLIKTISVLSTQLTQGFIESAQEIIGTKNVRLDAQSLKNFGRDRTTLWQAQPSVVLLPDSTLQVAALVKLANRHHIPIVPNGGRTGLSGGAVAHNGEAVIALDRMNQILETNTQDQTISCQAGVITQQLQESAAQHNLYYPVDFASAGSSQIGGNIATNAGGIKVIRYGMTRDWVRGLCVVTGQGDVLHLNNGLIKNNCGYDLQQLFIGSEGTLGIICEATMALIRQPTNLTVMVLGINSLNNIIDTLNAFQASFELSAFEFFDHPALIQVTANGRLRNPFQGQAPYYVLLEFEASPNQSEDSASDLFNTLLNEGIIADGVISHSDQHVKDLWRLREDISEQLASHRPYKNDISVRTSKLIDFVGAVEQLMAERYPTWQVIWYGHIGDGNLHLNILKPKSISANDFTKRCHFVSVELAALIKVFAGSISAEHGVGLLKKPFLESTRCSKEIDLMKQIKILFDPNNIMNPGKIFDV